MKVRSAGLFTRSMRKGPFEYFFYYLTYIPCFSDKKLTREKADKADLILVMDYYMITELMKKYQQPEEKIICLDIPRTYNIPYTPGLTKILEERLNEIKTFLYQTFFLILHRSVI